MTRRSAVSALLLAVVVLVGLVVAYERSGGSNASGLPPRSSAEATVGPWSPPPTPRDPDTGLPLVEPDSLPAEARHTITLILAGGPFPYAKDGVTFENREHALPSRPRGFYREYTVSTPGERDRGPRRIVTGDHDRQFFYTGDHYASFVRIRQ